MNLFVCLSLSLQLPPGHSHAPVTVTLQTAVDAAKLKSPIVWPLLVACSFLDPDRIPVTLLREFVADEQGSGQSAGDAEVLFDTAKGLLTSYSLLRDGPSVGSQATVAIHRLLQEVVRDVAINRQDDLCKRVRNTVRGAIQKCGDSDSSLLELNLAQGEAILRHGDDVSLLVLAGNKLLYSLRAPQRALPLLKRALAIQEDDYGKDHDEVAITLNYLGNVHVDLGDANKQKELLERALAIQEKHYEIGRASCRERV